MLQHMTHGERVRKRYAEWQLACSQGHKQELLGVVHAMRTWRWRGQWELLL